MGARHELSLGRLDPTCLQIVTSSGAGHRRAVARAAVEWAVSCTELAADPVVRAALAALADGRTGDTEQRRALDDRCGELDAVAGDLALLVDGDRERFGPFVSAFCRARAAQSLWHALGEVTLVAAADTLYAAYAAVGRDDLGALRRLAEAGRAPAPGPATTATAAAAVVAVRHPVWRAEVVGALQDVVDATRVDRAVHVLYDDLNCIDDPAAALGATLARPQEGDALRVLDEAFGRVLDDVALDDSSVLVHPDWSAVTTRAMVARQVFGRSAPPEVGDAATIRT